MLSKRERTVDNVSPSSSTSSPVAYRRTSIPSIIPLSLASALSSSIPSAPRRAPLAPLDPQLPFNTSLDDQMSTPSSSSSNSRPGFALPDSQKDGDRAVETARAYIGRKIISSQLEEDIDSTQQSLRKRSITGQ